MSSEYESMHEFGMYQERWFSKSAASRNKGSIRSKVVGYAITSFVTVVLLMDFPYSEIVAAVLVWAGSIVSSYIDESQIKALGLSERIIAEKLRLLNAQYSAKVITEEQYNIRVVDALHSQVVRYEEITVEMQKKD